MFIALLGFSRSLATTYVSLGKEPCVIGPTLIDLNPAEPNYYPSMVNVDECSGSCNAADDLTTKTCVLNKTKDINVKAFNMITIINEAKTLMKHISCDYKCKFNSTTA